MKTVCEKHGCAYEVDEGCADCGGLWTSTTRISQEVKDNLLAELASKGLPAGKLTEIVGYETPPLKSGMGHAFAFENCTWPISMSVGNGVDPVKIGTHIHETLEKFFGPKVSPPAMSHGPDEEAVEASRLFEIPLNEVNLDHRQRVKAKKFLAMADTVAQFLVDNFEEYGLDEADALNLVEMLDATTERVEAKEGEFIARAKR